MRAATNTHGGEDVSPDSRGGHAVRHLSPPPHAIGAHPTLVSIMSLPPVPTDPTELSALQQRARRLLGTVSDLIKHGQHSYVAFEARVHDDRPASDDGRDHFLDL